MLMKIYGKAYSVLMKKPLKLWGISLLYILLASVLTALCGAAIPALGIAVTLLMGTSMTMIFLFGYRGEEVKVVQLFSCFKDWQTIKRVLLGMSWMALWIFLWSLIPVAGPFIALIRMYEYRLTPYILVTEPDVSITEAIEVSKKRTDGYKLQMFLADLLVYGIVFVVNLVLGLIAGLCVAYVPALGVLFSLILIVLDIVIFALVPLFVGLVQAAFYEEIQSGKGKFCGNCGAPLGEGARFCTSCGQTVN